MLAPVLYDVVVIGGGITGLSAAWALQQAALRYAVLEESPRWGGKIHTERVEGVGGAPFILEAGADAFLTRKPWVFELARELGLEDRIQPVNGDGEGTFVLHRGQPVPLPAGLTLLAPTRLLPFLRSPLFSLGGKLRAVCDLFIPPRRLEDDESLADFVLRRLGAEMLDKLGEPLLAGVFNGDPSRLSIRATFPQFPALEREYGSVIRGARVKAAQAAPAEPPFISFKTGAGELIDALTAQLRGDLCLNASVRHIERGEAGMYRLILTNGKALETRAIITATPPFVTAKLLREIAPRAACALDAIPCSGIGTAYFAYRREAVPRPLNGLGLLVPRSERRCIDGVTYTTSKWAGRAPADHVLLRVFFGGARTRDMLDLDDAALVTALRAELKAILGITAAPLFERIYRWRNAYPQYEIGHLERVEEAEKALPAGIILAGSAYRGIGVPDCVRQGREAARLAAQAAAVGQRQ